MKRKHFSDHVKELELLFKEYLLELDATGKELEKAKEFLQIAIDEGSRQSIDFYSAQVKFEEAQKEKAVNDLREKYFRDIQKTREEFASDLNDFYRLRGDSLTGSAAQADIELLNSGINLSADEVISMIERHTDNYTMLRYINDRLNDRGDRNKATIWLNGKLEKAGAAETRLFNIAADNLTAIIRGDSRKRHYIDNPRGAAVYADIIAGIVGELDSLPIRPKDGSKAAAEPEQSDN